MQQEQNKEVFCLLVSPVFNRGSKNLLMMVREQDPPLNLCMLAAWIRNKNFKTEILDCGIQARTDEAFGEKIQHYKTTYARHKIYIGFYVCTPTAYSCYKMAAVAKEVIPDAVIMGGGPHATFMPEEVLTLAPFDIAVIGEGEITLEEILSQKAWPDIKGITFKDANRLIQTTTPRDRIKNLDTLPMPAYDLLDMPKYRPPVGSFIRLPSFLVTFSRGCINYCFFCTKTLGTDNFQKSPEAMVAEMQYLNAQFGIVDFVIADDTFTTHRDKVLSFCHLLLEGAFGFSWHAYTRVDHVDEPLLLTMKKAGCHQLMFGIESFDEAVLKAIGKNVTPDEQINAIQMTQKAGIDVRLSMMVGNMGDSPQACEKSIKTIRKLKPTYINVLIATPGPGTPFFRWAEDNGRLLTKDWSKYKGATAVVRLDNFTEKDIYRYFKKFYYAFYFHPYTIFRHLKRLHSKVAWYNFIEAVKRVFTFVLNKFEK